MVETYPVQVDTSVTLRAKTRSIFKTVKTIYKYLTWLKPAVNIAPYQGESFEGECEGCGGVGTVFPVENLPVGGEINPPLCTDCIGHYTNVSRYGSELKNSVLGLPI